MPNPISRSLAAIAIVAVLVAACDSATVSPSPASLASASVTPSDDTSPGASPQPSHRPKPSPTQAPVTAPPPTPVASSVDAALCAPGGVKLDVKGETTKSAVVLIVDVTNTSGAPCALATAPANIGLRAGGGSLPTTYEARQDPWPGDTPDAVAPPVVLRPNGKARARVVWKNWCDGLPADVSTVWVYFGTEALDASPEPFISPPACDNQAAESTLQGFPYQEDTSGG
jgi:hypothetical protein